MIRHLKFAAVALGVAPILAGCSMGPAATGSFDRNLDVTNPIRLDVSGTSGDVTVTGGSEGKVHIHANVRANGWFFKDAKDSLNEVLSNPPIEQHADSIRVGKGLSGFRDVSIDYTIQVPNSTEVNVSVASGGVNISNLHGPVKVDSASGSIRVTNVDGSVRINSASGSTTASNLGDDLHVSSASGSVSANSVKGELDVHALSGSIDVAKPGSRVQAQTASGTINVSGAANDVKAASASGLISVQGNPSGTSYWNLKTASGAVDITVPSSSAFYLNADAVSGDIRTSIPVVVEEQGRHSIRARAGAGGGRVEIHTISGAINVKRAS